MTDRKLYALDNAVTYSCFLSLCIPCFAFSVVYPTVCGALHCLLHQNLNGCLIRTRIAIDAQSSDAAILLIFPQASLNVLCSFYPRFMISTTSPTQAPLVTQCGRSRWIHVIPHSEHLLPASLYFSMNTLCIGFACKALKTDWKFRGASVPRHVS